MARRKTRITSPASLIGSRQSTPTTAAELGPPLSPHQKAVSGSTARSRINPLNNTIKVCAMKAIVYHEYGSPDVLELVEIDKPVVKDGEVLLKVRAASVNWLDWHFLTGTPLLARIMAGLLKPKNNVLGIDVAGRVEAVGANVTKLRPGDEVFGSSSHGCFAEYVSVSEEGVVTKPANMTSDEVAAVPGAAIPALQALRDKGHIQPGQRVLINGASGGVGAFAVQLAKSFGAEVTSVSSTGNLELLSSIGADHVIDYTQEDFTENGERYDLIFDAVAKRSFSECRRALGARGVYVTTGFSPVLALGGLWSSMTGDKKLVPLPPKPPSKRELVFMKELLEGTEITPIIDRCYPLSELPEALRYLEKGHARGKVVIAVASG